MGIQNVRLLAFLCVRARLLCCGRQHAKQHAAKPNWVYTGNSMEKYNQHYGAIPAVKFLYHVSIAALVVHKHRVSNPFRGKPSRVEHRLSSSHNTVVPVHDPQISRSGYLSYRTKNTVHIPDPHLLHPFIADSEPPFGTSLGHEIKTPNSRVPRSTFLLSSLDF